MTQRIAMWSGPRNISTAMMRAFENRADTSVVDEPFYACYLKALDLDHPGREEILQCQSSDWDEVVNSLTTAAIKSPIQYQKHMTHHILPNLDLAWTRNLKHIFLIRDPRRVIASYVKTIPQVTEADIGITRQLALYQQISEISGQDIPIIDSMDVLGDPKTVLKKVCERINISFDEAMLSWPAGKRESDGVWAPYWYANVEKSTGFAPALSTALPVLPDHLTKVANEAMEAYLSLFERRVR